MGTWSRLGSTGFLHTWRQNQDRPRHRLPYSRSVLVGVLALAQAKAVLEALEQVVLVDSEELVMVDSVESRQPTPGSLGCKPAPPR